MKQNRFECALKTLISILVLKFVFLIHRDSLSSDSESCGLPEVTRKCLIHCGTYIALLWVDHPNLH